MCAGPLGGRGVHGCVRGRPRPVYASQPLLRLPGQCDYGPGDVVCMGRQAGGHHHHAHGCAVRGVGRLGPERLQLEGYVVCPARVHFSRTLRIG